jgi:hypothetical protein
LRDQVQRALAWRLLGDDELDRMLTGDALVGAAAREIEVSVVAHLDDRGGVASGVVGDGWVKDGDYHTVASRTVLPLPTHRSPHYAETAGRLEDDPVYRERRDDFERYHTRYVSPSLVRDALRDRPNPR